ncbi:uncharacterized protein LOC111309453 [Durio zibethinus]|uniref:Uncharacterized protein LOC111309453 n=1 Tax=Durio zibethinus TaxID=66656 RepID=A0A6P6AH92_DURZI|nr:uncharacterized protein LOC111309453 [Durio zibethinus]
MFWIYFMKQKYEVALVFWKFKAWIENQNGCKIKIIKVDNDTKYTSDKFNEFCEVVRIEHQLTVTYILQQNEASERKNKTVMEMYGSKPLVQHIRVFGSIYYVFVPKIKKDKLDQKVKIYILWAIATSPKIIGLTIHLQSKEESIKQTVADMISFQDKKDYMFVNETIDHELVRKITPFIDIYQRSNVAILEPANFEEAIKIIEWKNAMKKEYQIIEKNQTWMLVDKPNISFSCKVGHHKVAISLSNWEKLKNIPT